MHAAHVGLVVERDAPAKPPIERLFEQCSFVDIAEDFVHCGAGDVTGDAERFDLPEHAAASAAPHAGLDPGAGERHAPVVQRAFLPQPLDSGLDVIGFELAAGETRAELPLGQLTPCQQFQTRQVGATGLIHRVSLTVPFDL